MFGVIAASFALGIRHGIDWDHIAAITDITSTTTATSAPRERLLTREPGVQLTDESHHALATTPSVVGNPAMLVASGGLSLPRLGVPTSVPALAGRRSVFIEQRRALLLGTLYALGHGSIVVALGLLAILASEVLPSWVDPIMTRVVGVTLILLALYLLYSLYQYFRRGEEFHIRSRWMLVFTAVGNLYHRLMAKVQPTHTHRHTDADGEYGARTAFGIGMIHGIGAETGTQALIIAGAAGATSKGTAVLSLGVFVVGLLVSNSFITIATATGFVSARQRQWVYIVIGAVAAVFSLVLGVMFVLGSDTIVPSLDRYLRWIGGPQP